ncbi:hypothetical protein [Streptomyces sp. NPDC047028]|uniref:hypothetical protein n=1 Tax=Streptomyces sp. NPDC047028 TaxID=3155793 RepID=UPI0033C04530
MRYRYWCGECGFRTAWLTQADGERQQIEHYAGKHPGTPPGGHVESARRNPDGGPGCLHLLAVVVLLLLIAAACHR